MPNYIATPLMNLPNPVPSVDPGPDYAQNLYNSLDIIDGHNHSAGSGNQINPNGILINADLPFNSYNATLLRSTRYVEQSAALTNPSDLMCSYAVGANGNLYWNDNDGNNIQITSGGAVNATSSGISSGTATASFSGGVLVVDQATNTPGNIQAGSILIGPNTASPNFITIAPPSGLAASYTLTQPAGTPATGALTLTNSSGTQSFITGTAAQTMRGGSTPGFASPNYQISSSCGTTSFTSTTFAQITNLSVTITTSGRPIWLFLQDDGSTNQSEITAGSAAQLNFSFFRGATQLNNIYAFFGASGESPFTGSAFQWLDASSAGTYTYTAQAKVNSGNALIHYLVLIAYEI